MDATLTCSFGWAAERRDLVEGAFTQLGAPPVAAAEMLGCCSHPGNTLDYLVLEATEMLGLQS